MEKPVDQLEQIYEKEADNEPTDEIRDGNPEIGTTFLVPVHLPKKPFAALQGDRVYDDVKVDKEKRTEEPDFQRTSDLPGFKQIETAAACGRAQDCEGRSVSSVGEEDETHRIHEGHAKNPQLVVLVVSI